MSDLNPAQQFFTDMMMAKFNEPVVKLENLKKDMQKCLAGSERISDADLVQLFVHVQDIDDMNHVAAAIRKDERAVIKERLQL